MIDISFYNDLSGTICAFTDSCRLIFLTIIHCLYFFVPSVGFFLIEQRSTKGYIDSQSVCSRGDSGLFLYLVGAGIFFK